MPQRIGFIGLGNMGKPLATRLIEAGFPVTVWNRTSAKSEELAKRGAKVARSPRELATLSDVIITVILDDAALEAITVGEAGLLAGLARGSILIEMSTLNPEPSSRLARALEERGATMLRAPLWGTPPQVEAGKLIIMISGERKAYEECREIFSTLGHKIFHVGEAEEARYLKLIHNTMLGISSQMLAETLAFGEKAGLKWEVMCEMLNNSLLASPVMTLKLGQLTKRDYKAISPVSMLAKDLDITLSVAKGMGVPMPATALTHQFLGTLKATGRGELDYAALLLLMEELSGIKR